MLLRITFHDFLSERGCIKKSPTNRRGNHFNGKAAKYNKVTGRINKLSTPSKDHNAGDQQDHATYDQITLYFFIVQNRVEFLHNLIFLFSNWFRSGFHGGTGT
jgi:hypothetical protein